MDKVVGLRRIVEEREYYFNGYMRRIRLVRYEPIVATSQMFSYISAEDVSCEDKKMTWDTSQGGAHPVWTLTLWRRVVVNRKTEYKCMTKAEADELKTLVCNENVSLSLTNQLNGWWHGTLSETVKGDWFRVNENHVWE